MSDLEKIPTNFTSTVYAYIHTHYHMISQKTCEDLKFDRNEDFLSCPYNFPLLKNKYIFIYILYIYINSNLEEVGKLVYNGFA